jgi:hypothetical protein
MLAKTLDFKTTKITHQFGALAGQKQHMAA